MPLKLIKRGRNWHIVGTTGPAGRRTVVRESTGTDSRDLAEAIRVKREREVYEAAIYGEKAVVSFQHAADSYLDSKPGITKGDARRVGRLSSHFALARLAEIDQAAADRACAKLCGKAATPATRLRAVITPLSAILMHASKRGWCPRPALERPPSPPSRTDWMTPAQATALIAAAADHLKPLLAFLLGTGARAGEALCLQWSDVDLTAGTVIFRNVPGERRTKSGRDRIARLPPTTREALANMPGERRGTVFRRPGDWQAGTDAEGKPCMVRGEPVPYQGERGQFRTGWDAAWRRAGLPGHMSPHSARHSWASWRYCVKPDALDLMRAGGWSSLELVARYAHQTPADLAPAIVAFWGAHPDEFPAAIRSRGASAA